MDITEMMLIGGGLIISTVLVLGIWVAWRAMREPLRLEIVHVDGDDFDEWERLRGELPSGGARIVKSKDDDEEELIQIQRTNRRPTSSKGLKVVSFTKRSESKLRVIFRGANSQQSIDAIHEFLKALEAMSPDSLPKKMSSRGQARLEL